jgi:hypothetical protein
LIESLQNETSATHAKDGDFTIEKLLKTESLIEPLGEFEILRWQKGPRQFGPGGNRAHIGCSELFVPGAQLQSSGSGFSRLVIKNTAGLAASLIINYPKRSPTTTSLQTDKSVLATAW